MTHRPIFALSLTLVILITGMAFSAESPADQFSEYTPGSMATLDHGTWNNLLTKYVDDRHPSGINLFNYAGVTSADRELLGEYLDILQDTDISNLDRDEQMAYWINFYNALTVQVILNAYPVESIRDISLPGSRGGPWKASLVTVKGTELSLDEIEHGILRPIWGDPRIHYAVNCASIGCPNLAPAAYTGENLESMLNVAARSYINHPRGVDRDGRRLVISSIYNWYKEDFGNKDELKTHLLQFADPDTAEMISGASGSIRYGYDWNLNSGN